MTRVHRMAKVLEKLEPKRQHARSFDEHLTLGVADSGALRDSRGRLLDG